MFRFKSLLFLSFFPIVYFIYIITSYDSGIGALLEKKKILKNHYNIQNNILSEISDTKKNIELLDEKNIDIDLFSEKAIDLLGKSESGSIAININNL